jgi:hypothetical protein
MQWENGSRGKKTSDSLEIAAAISLQVHRMSEEFRFSKAAGMPYERDARNNAQRRNDASAMADRYGSLEGRLSE